MKIPKVLFQTSRLPPKDYVVRMICDHLPDDWQYRHYTDAQVLDFFRKHSDPEFPDLCERFYTFRYGEHRADLFRYYYLYKCGGVFMDTDAMLKTNIENITKDYEFFSVNSSYVPNSVFQGFIGCHANHPIVYRALKDIYTIHNDIIESEFHTLCKNMFRFVLEDYESKHGINKTILYQEIYGNELEAHVVDGDGTVLMIHYHINKIIPEI
jgi:mannosyltransferase OCH1-like enzyme